MRNAATNDVEPAGDEAPGLDLGAPFQFLRQEAEILIHSANEGLIDSNDVACLFAGQVDTLSRQLNQARRQLRVLSFCVERQCLLADGGKIPLDAVLRNIDATQRRCAKRGRLG